MGKHNNSQFNINADKVQINQNTVNGNNNIRNNIMGDKNKLNNVANDKPKEKKSWWKKLRLVYKIGISVLALCAGIALILSILGVISIPEKVQEILKLIA